MARKTFGNWYKAFTKILKEKHGFTDNVISTMDKQSYKETYFDNGDTAEEAANEEISNLV